MDSKALRTTVLLVLATYFVDQATSLPVDHVEDEPVSAGERMDTLISEIFGSRGYEGYSTNIVVQTEIDISQLFGLQATCNCSTDEKQVPVISNEAFSDKCSAYTASHGFHCVPYYLCSDGVILSDGSGYIDVRFGPDSPTEVTLDAGDKKCEGYLEVCCRDPDWTPVGDTSTQPSTVTDVSSELDSLQCHDYTSSHGLRCVHYSECEDGQYVDQSWTDYMDPRLGHGEEKYVTDGLDLSQMQCSTDLPDVCCFDPQIILSPSPTEASSSTPPSAYVSGGEDEGDTSDVDGSVDDNDGQSDEYDDPDSDETDDYIGGDGGVTDDANDDEDEHGVSDDDSVGDDDDDAGDTVVSIVDTDDGQAGDADVDGSLDLTSSASIIDSTDSNGNGDSAVTSTERPDDSATLAAPDEPTPTTTHPILTDPTTASSNDESQDSSSPSPVEWTCGRHNTDGVGVKVNGYAESESQFGEWPHMCAIIDVRTKNDDSGYGPTKKVNVFQCGASLLGPDIVLTAAHCARKIESSESAFVRCGEWDTQSSVEPRPHVDRQIKRIIVHPEFVERNLFNDFALLFVAEPGFTISEHIGPVCLPGTQDEATLDDGASGAYGAQPQQAERCVVTGWGKDKFGKEGEYQVVLKEIDLPIMANDQCQSNLRSLTRLPQRFRLHESFMCAGGEEGVDSCQGDGGGPLACFRQRQDGSIFLQQTGIVAWGIDCGKADVPGVYASVDYAICWLDWVASCRDHADSDIPVQVPSLFGLGAAHREQCHQWLTIKRGLAKGGRFLPDVIRQQYETGCSVDYL